jgi:pentatricopeptide repeat protein
LTELQRAIRYSVEGPLHQAIGDLEEILKSDPASKTAAIYLADVYSRLGQYEKALAVLREIQKNGVWDAQMESQRKQLQVVREDLKAVENSRFRDGAFLSQSIVPDGNGGYLVDSLGFPGTWTFCAGDAGHVMPGAYLRLLKSLAWMTTKIHEQDLTLSGSMGHHEPGYRGTVRVSRHPPGPEDNIRLTIASWSGQGFKWDVTITPQVLSWQRDDQRSKLWERVKSGKYLISKEERADVSRRPRRVGSVSPAVLLISLGLASDYAVTILRDRLRHNQIPAAASFIRSMKYFDAYLENSGSVEEFDQRPPSIFAISVLDAVIEETCYCIARIRESFPEAFIVIGGSTSQTPEQFAALVSDFDILIRGDADEILGQVAKIIGSSTRTGGFSEEQIDSLTELAGGLIVQEETGAIVHRLDYTNVPQEYHLPHPDGRKTIYYWQTSRGCPYDCRFCNKWSGKRYHMVVPWEDDNPGDAMAQRSAHAMIEFLLARLAMEWPHAISRPELEQLLRSTRAGDPPLSLPGLPDKIFIVIEDDDFLIERQRIKEFHDRVDELGLQRFFVFSAITSVRTLYRGGDRVDRQLLGWLKDANFRSLDIGSDGLSQSTIDQNQKGYTLDRHVIPLNSILKEMGFFAFNNTIITTPYTTIPQLIESLIFYIVCPYPINIAIEIGIMGHIGNKFTNEDIVNQQYDWRAQGGDKQLYFTLRDNYRVPEQFPEYALNGSHMLSYADPKVRELVLEFPNRDPLEFFRDSFSEKDVQDVIDAWTNLPDSRPEFRALGRSIRHLRQAYPHWSFDYSLASVREDMSMLNLSTFTEYHDRLVEGRIQADPRYKRISRRRWNAGMQKKAQNWQAAEKELRLLIAEAPWYFRPQQELIVLLGNQGRIAEAIEHFVQYQLTDPNLRFYFMIFGQLLKALDIAEMVREERILFHIPRYFTISPIYYFLALIKELAGGSSVEKFVFSPVTPQDAEDLYDLFDFLTIETIKAVVAGCPFDLGRELSQKREVRICGIPVRLSEDGRSVLLGYDRIQKNSALEVSNRYDF